MLSDLYVLPEFGYYVCTLYPGTRPDLGPGTLTSDVIPTPALSELTVGRPVIL